MGADASEKLSRRAVNQLRPCYANAKVHPAMKDHRLIDQRSLAFGRAIAARLVEHPEFIARARATAARWLMTTSPHVHPALQEWIAALDGPVEGVVALLPGTDERATRLRQSNPFAGVLSQQERNAILLKFQAFDAAST